MKIKQIFVASSLALCVAVSGLPLGGLGVSSGILGVSKAEAQPAPGWRKPRPPVRRNNNSNNIGAGVAGAIIGLTVGAIAADAARKNARPRAPGMVQCARLCESLQKFRPL